MSKSINSECGFGDTFEDAQCCTNCRTEPVHNSDFPTAIGDVFSKMDGK